MPANFFITGLDINIVKHILPPERLGDAFGFVFSQRMFRIDAGYFKKALVNLNHSDGPQRHPRRYLDVVYVVNLEVAGLLDPVFDEWIAQGVLGLSLVEIGAFDDEAILAVLSEMSLISKVDARSGRYRSRF